MPATGAPDPGGARPAEELEVAAQSQAKARDRLGGAGRGSVRRRRLRRHPEFRSDHAPGVPERRRQAPARHAPAAQLGAERRDARPAPGRGQGRQADPGPGQRARAAPQAGPAPRGGPVRLRLPGFGPPSAARVPGAPAPASPADPASVSAALVPVRRRHRPCRGRELPRAHHASCSSSSPAASRSPTSPTPKGKTVSGLEQAMTARSRRGSTSSWRTRRSPPPRSSRS